MRRLIVSFLKYTMYIFLSLLLALAIRLFLCNFYVVPSDSMEPVILPGDFILTDKWTYGGRIFTNLKIVDNDDLPMVRVPGFRNIRRNDVVVFNFPYRDGWDTIRMNFEKVFVKRCIGLPGDSLSAINGFYHVSVLEDTLGYIPGQKQFASYRSTLDSVIIRAEAFDESHNWDVFDFGPFYIPVAGRTVALTPDNFKLYRKLIVYETGAAIRLEADSSVFINDKRRHDYTFQTNWYFVAGDKALNSQDSRYLGLIPEDYIIGRASLVLTSKDKFTGRRRWSRLLKPIK